MSTTVDNTTLHIRIENVHDVSSARRQGMETAVELGFPRADATKIAVVISELARNILVYANKGSITILTRKGVGSSSYIKIIADDKGPGIDNLDLAMSDGWTTSGGLGLGLSGSKRLMDEFNIDSQPGRGTTITAVKWLK